MRIAQLIVAEVADADLYETDVISETIRGAGGFGSTGTGRRDGQG
jgi:dUTP pyrophosphatase